MPITASTYAAGHAQRDGTRYVRERHTHSDGRVIEREYGPVDAAKIDCQAVADAYARRLDAALADQELQAIVDGLLAVTAAKERSKERLAEALRDLLRQYKGVELCRLARRVLALIASGQVTDADWRIAFGGLTVNQWNTVKNTLTGWASALNTVENAAAGF